MFGFRGDSSFKWLLIPRHEGCPHWDDVQWPWQGSIPQRSRSHKTFKTSCPRYFLLRWDGFSSRVQILFKLYICCVTLLH